MSIDEPQMVYPKNYHKMSKIYQNLDILVTWTQLIKCSGWGFYLSLIIYLQQIYWECGRRGGLLLSEPVSQYSCSVRTFLNLTIMIEHIKIIILSCLDSWLLFGQVPHRSYSRHLFWNLKDLMLVQILYQRRKITYQLSVIGFFWF